MSLAPFWVSAESVPVNGSVSVLALQPPLQPIQDFMHNFELIDFTPEMLSRIRAGNCQRRERFNLVKPVLTEFDEAHEGEKQSSFFSEFLSN